MADVRAWTRADWGPEGETMAWCCTEGDLAYVGDRPVVESLAEELDVPLATLDARLVHDANGSWSYNVFGTFAAGGGSRTTSMR